MYDIDRPKFIFISLLEEFIRETERSLAYFFALIVFLLSFLLALFGRDVLYTGLIGVSCLLLIKMRDIIDGFRELPECCPEIPARAEELRQASAGSDRTIEDMQDFYTAFDDAAIAMMAREFPKRFKESKQPVSPEKPNLLSYLHTCWKIAETVSVFFPERPLEPETKQSLEKMTASAQKYLFHFLEKKYSLSKAQMKYLEKTYGNPAQADTFLFQAQLEADGVDEKTAAWSAKVVRLLGKFRRFIDMPEKSKNVPAENKEEEISVPSPVPDEKAQTV